MHDYLKSGRQALRLLYVIIISLAIAKAISILFMCEDTFTIPTQEQTFLFIVFFSFISRFFLGAYSALSYDVEIEFGKTKIVIDAVGFLFQALAFYVFALRFHNLIFSQFMIYVICAIDLLWLLLLAIKFNIKDKTFTQWIIHNIIMLIFIPINMNMWNNLYYLFGISILALFVDIALNSDYYFAVKQYPHLKIFIAGPYGDEGPPNEIVKNVQEADRIGKELALKGHFPFIPHTMLHGWEKDSRFTTKHFKAIDYTWLEFCDALFLITESPGANIEKEMAERRGLRIFYDLKDVPEVKK